MPDTEPLLRTLAAPAFDARSLRPIWKQIADRLQAACADGRLSGKARLPGEIRMAEIFGVTRVTMRRALARLQQEGILQARKGVGIFVRPMPLRYRLDHGNRFADGLNLPGAKIGATTLALDRGTAEPEEAEALNLAPGDPVIRLTRLRQVDEAPVYLSRKTFPAAALPGFEAAYAPRSSVRDVFQAHGIATYRRVQTRVSGGFASDAEAAALRLSPRMPVLRTVALNAAPGGQVLEYNLGTWPLTAVELVLTPHDAAQTGTPDAD
ncbi:MAG: phosphonate metabolism transcriptional regulator PhnF [Rhodobacterales bacterium]|nr:phosphonate metabolism transcriptional regulator PhnF [Rhodobacterales bacterium]